MIAQLEYSKAKREPLRTNANVEPSLKLYGNSLNSQSMEGHHNAVICLLVKNRLMYTGSADGGAKCWVTEFGDCTRQYSGHKGSVIMMKFDNGIRESPPSSQHLGG